MEFEYISSRNNQVVKWVASLSEKKYRQKSSSFIAEGIKLTQEALSSGLTVTHILVCEDNSKEILAALRESIDKYNGDKPKIYVLPQTTFEKVSTEKAPQGVICVIKYLDFFFNIDIIYKEEFFLDSAEKAIALYSVRDPSNLGAIIRSAVAFGIDHIVLSSDCADLYNPKTIRSSMGGVFKIKATRVESFEDFIGALQYNGRRAIVAELRDESVPLTDLVLNSGDVFVIGNEGHGISSSISQLCDKSLYIPISPKTESLNASVAASILMWEISKTR